jgi:hypothetical protein
MRFCAAVVVLALAFALAPLSACKKEAGPIDGIGAWHIGKTKVAQGTICQPQENSDLTWCSHNPEMVIAEHRASVDLYFRGAGDAAVLVEILLAMAQPCNTEALDKWLTHRLGAASEKRGLALVWRGEAATIVGLLPARDGECLIHFLDPKDQKRLGELTRQPDAPAAE